MHLKKLTQCHARSLDQDDPDHAQGEDNSQAGCQQLIDHRGFPSIPRSPPLIAYRHSHAPPTPIPQHIQHRHETRIRDQDDHRYDNGDLKCLADHPDLPSARRGRTYMTDSEGHERDKAVTKRERDPNGLECTGGWRPVAGPFRAPRACPGASPKALRTRRATGLCRPPAPCPPRQRKRRRRRGRPGPSPRPPARR